MKKKERSFQNIIAIIQRANSNYNLDFADLNSLNFTIPK